MSAAARGAAGFLYRQRTRRTTLRVIAPSQSDLEAFALSLERKGMSAERARELAAEQAKKPLVTVKRRRALATA